MDIKLNKSKFNKATSMVTEPDTRPVIITAKSHIIEVYLENDEHYSIDLHKKTKYRISKNYLYCGLLHKLGKISYIKITEAR